MNRQLALALQLNTEATLDNFLWGENALLEAPFHRLVARGEEPCLYVWGPDGCGKSHLLQAACNAASGERSAVYLPLALLKPFGPETLEGMDCHDVLAIDDVDAIAGDRAFEEALFHLYNRVRAKEGAGMLFAARKPLRAQGIQLADLRSRLSAGLVAHLQPLSDEDKIRSLQRHAHSQGFILPESTARFLLNHCSRDMHTLQRVLRQLDEASLAAKRRVTVPFVKAQLGL
ncbi:DnaA-like family protein [Legionella geestiana]|uniref:DnaA-like family protein n=1 Tax=Legionella geestiana TaxID=45065 RepID=A0A0W0TLN9_9GAMM|nr:DnaA regulatory inactivator Hda [Legionella geestiana]KTC96483.1 DnaA-like family protein [Legionella geestiana]QBS12525.1 DnaA regulatory inactivator Hda [Legionella geestiana]QDQ39759.1 DnaA regulatory inactivator Hda [Legionella geestiana]STX55029.1 DnaA-like family protein [Legionella geestiana]